MTSIKNNSRILIIDDDVHFRNLICSILKISFDNIILAEDASEALLEFEENPPVIIVTDLKIPLVNGLELITLFRKEDPDIPIIAISSEPKSLPAALAIGANDVLDKSFLVHSLSDLIVKNIAGVE